MLRRRVLTALVGIPVVLGAVWLGPPWLTVLAATAAVIGVWEAYRLYPPTALAGDGAPATALPILLGGTWAVALVLAGELAASPRDFGLAAAGICAAGGIIGGLWLIAAWHGRRLDAAAAWLLAPPVYIGGALAGAVALRGIGVSGAGRPAPETLPEIAAESAGGIWLLPDIAGREFAQSAAGFTEYGAWWLLLGILTVYAADSAAFFVGRRIGRHRMAPGVSPGKTWEGTAGGLAGAVIAAVALGVLFPLRLDIWQLALIGVIVGVAAPVGDLLESKIKRMADAKDSGSLLPGHGGMLDRLDSLLPSLILVYILAVLAAAAA